MLAYRDTRDRVQVAFTDRHGGVSAGPYASLNLGYGVGDAETVVGRNIDLAVAAFTDADSSEVRVAGMHQAHGSHVHVFEAGQDRGRHGPQGWPTADALATAEPGVVLLVRSADCVPVLLADTATGAVAAVHAGRSGLATGVVARALAGLRRLGVASPRSAGPGHREPDGHSGRSAHPGQLTAWIGPHVCGACYEVPEQLRDKVSARVPEARSTTAWGTPALDLGAGVAAQLRAGGVDDIIVVRRCTREDDDLFSYRRQGTASGRLGGLVWIRP